MAAPAPRAEAQSPLAGCRALERSGRTTLYCSGYFFEVARLSAQIEDPWDALERLVADPAIIRPFDVGRANSAAVLLAEDGKPPEAMLVVARGEGGGVLGIFCASSSGDLPTENCRRGTLSLLADGVPAELLVERHPESFDFLGASVRVPDRACTMLAPTDIHCPVHGELTWGWANTLDDARATLSRAVAKTKDRSVISVAEKRDVACSVAGGTATCQFVVYQVQAGGRTVVLHAYYVVAEVDSRPAFALCSYYPDETGGEMGALCSRALLIE